MREGYKELELHCPVIAVAGPGGATIDPKIAQLTDLIMRSAGNMINSYLSVAVDALSVNQISRGRAILKKVVDLHSPSNATGRQELLELVKEFYNTVPSKLPSRIDPDQIVGEFVADLREQEDRLDQLEAGLATYAATLSGHNPLGNVKIKVTPQTSKSYEQIVDYVLRTAGGRLNVRDIFSIEIPKERKAFQGETVGKSNVLSLFHGTHNHNVRHILRTGLIVPITSANGRRMGDGVYFSDRTQRSLAYCGGHFNQRLLFVADVALGRIWSTTGTYAGKHAPAGYDSTQGTGTRSGHGDEFVIYKRFTADFKVPGPPRLVTLHPDAAQEWTIGNESYRSAGIILSLRSSSQQNCQPGGHQSTHRLESHPCGPEVSHQAVGRTFSSRTRCGN